MCFGEGSEGSRGHLSWQEGVLAAKDISIEEWRNSGGKSFQAQYKKAKHIKKTRNIAE